MLVPCWSGSSRGVDPTASLRGRCKSLDWRAAVSSNERRQPSLSELWSEERVREPGNTYSFKACPAQCRGEE